jgi:hypothetical protein
MLINFARSINKKLLPILLLMMLTVPSVTIHAQSELELLNGTETEEVDATEVENTEVEVKAEKKKGPDLVTINERFLYSVVIDITMVLLILIFVYYPNYKKLDTVFTFIVFNIVILLLTFVLNKVKISMGAAFGLFAVFSMLRYRTEGIGMKDMTYLFVFIAVGLISGIQLETSVLLVICGIIFLFLFVLDSNIFLRREFYQVVDFEKIEMVKPELRDDLINELKNRTGLNIHRISIYRLDYLRDIARIKVYYYADKKLP